MKLVPGGFCPSLGWWVNWERILEVMPSTGSTGSSGRTIRRVNTGPIVCKILKMGGIYTQWSEFLGVSLPRRLRETMGSVLSSTGGTGSRGRALPRSITVPILCEKLNMGGICTQWSQFDGGFLPMELTLAMGRVLPGFCQLLATPGAGDGPSVG